MSEFAAAEAIFGSASRGDNDALSDRDIIIIDDNTTLLARRRTALEAAGWSVASYTFAKLAKLACNGALFVQHLKAESKVVRDDGRLKQLLADFMPKDSYLPEIEENARLAKLVAVRPDTRAGALWAADVLYVTTRNFGILRLAEEGRYLFSYSRVLEALAEENVIDAGAVSALLKLRLAKSIYRSGERVAEKLASRMVEQALDALPKPLFPKASEPVLPLDVLEATKPLPAGTPAYHRLRNLERAYLSLRAVSPSSETSNGLATLARWIENPRAYASLAARMEDKLISEFHHLADSLEVQWLNRVATASLQTNGTVGP